MIFRKFEILIQTHPIVRFQYEISILWDLSGLFHTFLLHENKTILNQWKMRTQYCNNRRIKAFAKLMRLWLLDVSKNIIKWINKGFLTQYVSRQKIAQIFWLVNHHCRFRPLANFLSVLIKFLCMHSLTWIRGRIKKFICYCVSSVNSNDPKKQIKW